MCLSCGNVVILHLIIISQSILILFYTQDVRVTVGKVWGRVDLCNPEIDYDSIEICFALF